MAVALSDFSNNTTPCDPAESLPVSKMILTLKIYSAILQFWQVKQPPLARVQKVEETLAIAQTNGAALRDLRVSLAFLLQWTLIVLFLRFVFPHFYPLFGGAAATAPFSLVQLLFLGLLPLWCVARSINRMFGRRTCVLDKNRDALIYNGFTVGPLQEIRAVKAQVKNGAGKNPMFRLVLEMQHGLTLILVESYYFQAPGDFLLGRNPFGDPNKRFASFQNWLDCDRQDLVPFVLPEIADLRQQITNFLER